MKLINNTMDIYQSELAPACTRDSESPPPPTDTRTLSQSRASSQFLHGHPPPQLPTAPPPSPTPTFRVAEGPQSAPVPPLTQGTTRGDSESTIPRKRSVEDDSPSTDRPAKAPCFSHRERSHVIIPSSIQPSYNTPMQIGGTPRPSLPPFSTSSQATNQMRPPPPSGFAVGGDNGGGRVYHPTALRELARITTRQASNSTIERHQHRQAVSAAPVGRPFIPERSPQVPGVARNMPRVTNCEEETTSVRRNPNIQGSCHSQSHIPAGAIRGATGTDIGDSQLRLPVGAIASPSSDLRQVFDFHTHPERYRSSEGLASNPYLPLIQHAPVPLYPMRNIAFDIERRQPVVGPEVPPSARAHSGGPLSSPNQDVQRRSVDHLPMSSPQETRPGSGMSIRIADLAPNRYNVSSRVKLLDVGRDSGASKSSSRPRKLLIEVLIEDNDEDSEDDDLWEHEDQVESFSEGNGSPVPRHAEASRQGHPVEPQRPFTDLVCRQSNETPMFEARSPRGPNQGPCQCSSCPRLRITSSFGQSGAPTNGRPGTGS